MSINLAEVETLIHEEKIRREHESPRTLEQLAGYITYIIATSIAAAYDSQTAIPPDKSRVLFLLQNDPLFHTLVNSAVGTIMNKIEDYERHKEHR